MWMALQNEVPLALHDNKSVLPWRVWDILCKIIDSAAAKEVETILLTQVYLTNGDSENQLHFKKFARKN